MKPYSRNIPIKIIEARNKGIVEINVAKNRNGQTGMCQVQFNPRVGTFASC